MYVLSRLLERRTSLAIWSCCAVLSCGADTGRARLPNAQQDAASPDGAPTVLDWPDAGAAPESDTDESLGDTTWLDVGMDLPAELPDADGTPDLAPVADDAFEPVPDADDWPDLDPAAEPDAAVEDVTPECPSGMICVTSLPFEATGNTLLDGATGIGSYACKPSADESGPEVVFRVEVPKEGFLSAAVFDGSGVDVDVHLLSALQGDACLARGDRHAAADVSPGIVYVVVDSYVSSGEVLAGPYTVQIGLYFPSSGPCAMQSGIMKRVGDGGEHLAMPATGPIVMEAHLVTQEEPAPFPTTSTEELQAHYALSQAETGLVMHRTQDWAPLEGGSFYGAGIGSPSLFPVLHEGWYVNMYWTSESRPPRGTPEETHFYLRTGHLDVLKLGLAVDTALPFGPRTCTD